MTPTIAVLAAIIVVLGIVFVARRPGSATALDSISPRVESIMRGESAASRSELSVELARAREETAKSIMRLQSALEEKARRSDESLVAAIGWLREGSDQRMEALSRDLADRQDRIREEAEANRRTLHEDIAKTLGLTTESLTKSVGEFSAVQRGQMEMFGSQIADLVEANDRRFDTLRLTVENRLTEIRDRNAEQLDQLRATVDEKLQGTLEKRLGDSFKQVSERLELVHRGLGEMQTIAAGVGDLKRVLTNVRNRGAWGEVQLECLLDQLMTHDQYQKNVGIKSGTVEFAICLPSRGEEAGITYLPIDAKFPMDDYQHLVEAQEKGDSIAVEVEAAALEQAIKKCAKDISEKYIDPPQTTDFAIMYLPLEGLFAEVIRRPGLMEKLQTSFRVTVAGPTTLTAMLNSLQMGFRTLAIQKRSSEVWKILAAVKTDFGNFATILERVDKQIKTVSTSVSKAASKSRTIERRLRSVEQLPADEAEVLLADGEDVDHESTELVSADEEPNLS